MKVTFKASADIALVKYWGKKDEVLRLPENGSISIILDGLDTFTSVELDENLTADEVIIEGDRENAEVSRVVKHLDRIRKLANSSVFARVDSRNTFPKATGLSSSGSGFAALTYAALKAYGLSFSEKEISILARQGSGTACRCVCGGFVEWKNGDTSDSSYSKTLFPPSHWDIRDVIAIVDEGTKKISSTEGHELAQSSPFFTARQTHIDQKIQLTKAAITAKDFKTLGELVEAEALEFHSILFTSVPPIVLWYPGTLAVFSVVEALRKQGIPAYFTVNTGFNVHVLTLPEYEEEVRAALDKEPLVMKTLLARVGDKPHEI